ncbi:MAG: TatD family hydrolase [Bacteroidaceae bacterium]|nr:TatD family hydrolase [Bacteroidaceae bacterium]
MNILDIHTHVLPEEPGSALVCIGSGPVPEGALEQGHLFSAGLHPWDVTEDFDSQLDILETLLANPRVPAVGECGFDALKGPSHELQEQAFIRQIELSEHYAKPMILHVVRDFDSVIRLRRTLKPTQPWLIHGFRGGPEQMKQLYSHGILVSFGLKHNPESLRQVPSDRLFLETDGHDTIGQTISLASALRATPPQTIEEQITRNTTHLLSPR